MNLIQTSNLTIIEREPRVRDVDLAEWLGFSRPLDIRELVARNRDELETYGNFPCRTEKSIGRGRPGKAYYLNEGQALVVCALSRTQKAAEVRKQLIDVFMAYRSGKLVTVKEHHRRLPKRQWGNVRGYDANLSLLQSMSGNSHALLSIIAGMITRIEELEGF